MSSFNIVTPKKERERERKKHQNNNNTYSVRIIENVCVSIKVTVLIV